MFEDKPQKGTTLYLSLIVMTILLGISLGLNSIFLGQIKTVRSIGYSVVAFYAADAGIEEVLTQRSSPSSVCTKLSPCSLDNGAQYWIVIETTGVGGCLADNYCITSVGVFQETRRAIEIEY